MKTETKTILVEKMDEAGHGLARLADMRAIDHDGDTYTLGAFSWKEGGEQWVPLLPAHNRGAMSFGKARVYEENGVAFAELHLNLNTAAGKDWHSTLKFDLATGRPAQEWSYGFAVVDAVNEQRGAETVRNLKRVDVHEVSPVIRGAGVGTGTLSMKSRGSFAEQIDAVIAEIDDVVDRAGGVAALRVAEGREMSKARLDQLAQLKSRLDELLAADAGKAKTCSKCGSGELDAKGVCKSCGAVETDGKALADAIAASFLTRGARRRLKLD